MLTCVCVSTRYKDQTGSTRNYEDEKNNKELKLACAWKHFAFPSDRAKGASKPQA